MKKKPPQAQIFRYFRIKSRNKNAQPNEIFQVFIRLVKQLSETLK